MELEDLRNFAPAAQNEFLLRHAYTEEAHRLEAVRESLLSRIITIVDEFTTLSTELGCSYGMYVNLEQIPEGQDEETGVTLPSGSIGVYIRALAPDSHGQGFHPTSHPKPSGELAYGLDYYFVEGEALQDLTRDPRGSVLMDSETTLGSEVNIRGTAAFRSDRMGVEDLPSMHYSPGNAVQLQNYADTYLPARIVQIESIERSLEIIKAALDTPELNPTVELIRADNELSARTEALMNDQDDQEEAAQRPRRRLFRD